MPKQKPQPKKPGRPILEKQDYKGKIVPVRFKPDDFEKITKVAQKNGQTVSQWIRSTLTTALEV
jgi:predicted HicB family RNase H-like nuclease